MNKLGGESGLYVGIGAVDCAGSVLSDPTIGTGEWVLYCCGRVVCRIDKLKIPTRCLSDDVCLSTNLVRGLDELG